MRELPVPLPPLLARRASSLVAAFLIAAATFTFFTPPALAAPGDITGAIFEDIDGDQLAVGAIGDLNNPGVAGVNVYLYDDNNVDGIPDIGDTLTVGPPNPAVTNGVGVFLFAGLGDGNYLVVVDSQTVAPSVAINPPYTVVHTWAQQTYGVVSAWCADGVGGSLQLGAAGSCYGGRQAGVSDVVPGANPAANEHVTAVNLVGGAGGVGTDSGYSFNVVTNALATTVVADNARSAQGSLDQFLANANALAGANSMRFVPADPPNDGSGLWWRMDYSAAIDPLEITHDVGTWIDGSAFNLVDGVTPRNQNLGFLGANAAGGMTVGTAPVALPQTAKPELEIKAEGVRAAVSGALVPDGLVVRDLSVWDDAVGIQVGAGTIDNVLIERNVVGTPPDMFADPTSSQTKGIDVLNAGTGNVISDNLIGFLDQAGIHLQSATDGWTVSGNEVRQTGQVVVAWDAILAWGTNHTFTGNLLDDNAGMGIDINSTDIGGHTVENNTITASGQGGAQTAGIRAGNDSNTIRFNVIQNNAGPGIIVYLFGGGSDSALDNEISQNAFGGNGGIAVDLALTVAGADTGDGINTPNDGPNAGAGNNGLDHPIISSAIESGGTTTVVGTVCALCRVEIYQAVGDIPPPDYNDNTDPVGGTGADHGEGIAYLGGGTADGAGNFSIGVTGVSSGDEISAIALEPLPAPSNTSEFGPNFTVTNSPPVLDPVGDKSVDETVLLSFTATATDPNLGDSLTFSLEGSPPAGAAITAGGAFTWTPTEAQGAGVYAITIRVTDDGTPAMWDEETINVTVAEINNPPVLDPVGDKSVDETVLLSFTATAIDGDPPPDTLTFSLEGSPPAGAAITVGGSFTWTPTDAQGPGVYAITIRVTDDGAGLLWDEETINVTVNDTNVAPVLDPVGDKSVDETVLLSFTATATDADDPSDTLTFSLEGSPPAGAAITAGGAFTWTPTEAQGGSVYPITIRVTDDGAGLLWDEETINVTVNDTNVAPVLDPVGDQSVDETLLLSFTATASDADDPADTLTFSLEGSPPAGAAITAGGAFTWTPTEAQGAGVYPITIRVTDDGTGLLWDEETINVTVNDTNVAPVLDPIGDQSVAIYLRIRCRFRCRVFLPLGWRSIR